MKKKILLLFLAAVFFLLCGCNKKQETSEFWAMNTYCTITAPSSAVSAAEKAVNDAAALLENAGGEQNYLFADKNMEFTLAEPVAEAVKTSLEISEMTDGAFDITIAPLSKLWNITERTVPPTEKEIEDALKLVGYKSVSLAGNTVIFSEEGRGIDIGAVGKGMAAKASISALKEQSVEEAIVNLGGNVCVLGDKNGEKYKIGIKDPKSDGLLGYVSVGNTSVVTSGVYERNFEYDGKIYHHILDTSTGYPADNGLLSVTVVCDDPVAADILSTAFFVVGKEKAATLFEKCTAYGVKTVIFVSENGGIYTVGQNDLFTLGKEEYFFEN